MVERQNGAPYLDATCAPAISPAVFIILVKPVGAIPKGIFMSLPKSSTLKSALSTFLKILGWNSMFSNARLALFNEISWSAAPSV